MLTLTDEVDVHFTDQVDANSSRHSNDPLAKVGIGFWVL